MSLPTERATELVPDLIDEPCRNVWNSVVLRADITLSVLSHSGFDPIKQILPPTQLAIIAAEKSSAFV